MEFRFHIPNLGNLFFFVQNFAEWHHSCRERDNRYWIEKLGPLSRKEKKAVAAVKEIMEKDKYGFGSSKRKERYENLFVPFYTLPRNEVFEELEAWMRAETFEELRGALDAFRPRFEQVWEQEFPKLKSKKKWLLDKFAAFDTSEIVEKLERFFKTSEVPQTVDIYLLINAAPNRMGGGANLGRGRITLEISNSAEKRLRHAPDVIWHETTHLFQQDYFNALLGKYKNRIEKPKVWPQLSYNKRSVLCEPITHSLFTDCGYLSQKVLESSDPANCYRKRLGKGVSKLKKNREKYHLWCTFGAYHIFSVTGEYLENGKTVNDAYFERLLEIWRDYLKVLAD